MITSGKSGYPIWIRSGDFSRSHLWSSRNLSLPGLDNFRKIRYSHIRFGIPRDPVFDGSPDTSSTWGLAAIPSLSLGIQTWQSLESTDLFIIRMDRPAEHSDHDFLCLSFSSVRDSMRTQHRHTALAHDCFGSCCPFDISLLRGPGHGRLCLPSCFPQLSGKTCWVNYDSAISQSVQPRQQMQMPTPKSLFSFPFFFEGGLPTPPKLNGFGMLG